MNDHEIKRNRTFLNFLGMKSNVIWYFDFVQSMFNLWQWISYSLFINIKPFRYSCFFKLSEWSWSGPRLKFYLFNSPVPYTLCITWSCYRWSNRCSRIGTKQGNSRFWCGIRWWWSDRGSRFLPRAISGQLAILATTLIRIFWQKSENSYKFTLCTRKNISLFR